jgi:hypothetical protein
MAICLVALQIQAVVAASDGRGRLTSVVIAALMPTMFQLMFLYVLRRLYRQNIGEESTGGI